MPQKLSQRRQYQRQKMKKKPKFLISNLDRHKENSDIHCNKKYNDLQNTKISTNKKRVS